MANNNNNNKYPKSFQISLSAISCAIAVIFLLLGTLSKVLLASGYILAAVALCIPLSKNFYWGDFLAYLGTCILTLLLGAIGQIWDLVPFIMFFGLHPLANALCQKFKINKIIAYVIKSVWLSLTFWVMYLIVFGGFIGTAGNKVYEFVNQYIYIAIPIAGFLFLFVYDIFIKRCQRVINALVYRIRK